MLFFFVIGESKLILLFILLKLIRKINMWKERENIEDLELFMYLDVLSYSLFLLV